MAGASSRNKGAGGEREVIRMLQPIVDRCCDSCGQVRFLLRRNYTQRFQSKEYDIDGLPWIALEVKRVENQSGVESWWRQTLASARDGQIPVLLYRPNHQKWRARLRVPIKVTKKISVRCTVTMGIEAFLIWFEQKIKSELQ